MCKLSKVHEAYKSHCERHQSDPISADTFLKTRLWSAIQSLSNSLVLKSGTTSANQKKWSAKTRSASRFDIETSAGCQLDHQTNLAFDLFSFRVQQHSYNPHQAANRNVFEVFWIFWFYVIFYVFTRAAKKQREKSRFKCFCSCFKAEKTHPQW